jgi:chromosome segregation ATPase
LRSEVKKLKAESDNAKASSQDLQRDLATVCAQLANEKRANAKLKGQASRGKDGIDELRTELNKLRSEFETEKLESSKLKKELDDLRAGLKLIGGEFEAGSGVDTSVNPETREDLAQIVNMNEMLRRVIQGDRVYRDEMYGKIHSLRKKVGPLLAKVDELQETVDVIKAHFSAHDAPIELIMDFVRNFHQWWVDRYNARHEGDGNERTDGPQP